MRRTGIRVIKMAAGLALALVAVFSLTQLSAAAQSSYYPPSTISRPSTTAFPRVTVPGGLLARTGAEQALPVLVAGGLIVAVLGARRLARGTSLD